MSLEIILIILIGAAALAVIIWFIVRQFRAKRACDLCPYSDICEKEEDKPHK
jgi:hypothetical protein